jgi:hypothetical protein
MSSQTHSLDYQQRRYLPLTSPEIIPCTWKHWRRSKLLMITSPSPCNNNPQPMSQQKRRATKCLQNYRSNIHTSFSPHRAIRVVPYKPTAPWYQAHAGHHENQLLLAWHRCCHYQSSQKVQRVPTVQNHRCEKKIRRNSTPSTPQTVALGESPC